MRLGARNDLFICRLPKEFFPDVTTEKFLNYTNRLPSLRTSIQDLINSSIQSISIPAINFDPAEQLQSGSEDRKRGRITYYRDSIDKSKLIDNTFNITFRALEGYINYWILFDLYLYHYAFPNDKIWICDIPVHMLDLEGNVIFSVIFERCLFTGISQIELNYSSNDNSFKEFECNFACNDITYKFLKT